MTISGPSAALCSTPRSAAATPPFDEVRRKLILPSLQKCVYIHDWWLSPELYLRRPGEAKWRLDNIMKKKAEEGVKFHVIV